MKKLKRYFSLFLAVMLILNGGSVSTSAATNKRKVKSIQVPSTPANILVVKKGQKYKLKVKVATTGKISKKVTYTIAKPNVATVTSAGRIKGIKKGTTKLIVRSVANPKIKKIIKVKVGTPVKKVRVTKKKVSLVVDQIYRIKTKISPKKSTYKKLAYKSSNKAVAKVSKKGKVTALMPGVATITIKSKDGSNKKAKCKITVTGQWGSDDEGNPVPQESPDGPVKSQDPARTQEPVKTYRPASSKAPVVPTVPATPTVPAVPTVPAAPTVPATPTVSTTPVVPSATMVPETPVEVTGVMLNKSSAIMDEGATLVLAATVVPSNATNKNMTWTSSNIAVAMVSEAGTVTAVKAGTATITAETANGRRATCTVTVQAKTEPANPTVSEEPQMDLDKLFQVPYISNYYFNTKPSIDEEIEIPLYFTDFENSEYLNNDTTRKLDLLYEVDEVARKIEDLPLGDYTLKIGKLSKGMHTFSVQVLDKRTGMKSHRLYKELWVIDPAEYAISEADTYYMTEQDLISYKIRNTDSTNANDLVTTRDGLTALFADKQAEGYRKIVLLKGTYRINGENSRKTCITIPSYFTVDMNESTFKLDTIETDNEGCIVRMDDAVDAHLTNGTLEGDRFERQQLGLETVQASREGKGEPINTLIINGGKYCSVDNVEMKATTGHTILNLYVNGPSMVLKDFTPTVIVDGEEIAKEGCSTSSMVDLKEIMDWDEKEDYVFIGHWQGYRGIQSDSPIVYVSFYDENKNFKETITGYQFRKIRIPNGAKYARVTLLGTNIPTDYYNDNNICIFTTHLGDYHEIRNVSFVDTRACALAPAVCNNLLIEGCTFTRSGNSITPAAVDFEDGAQQCQDIFYRKNTVLEPAGNATVIDNYGFNHVYEDCTNHQFEIRNRVLGGVMRNINDVNSKIIKWNVGDKLYGEYVRIYDNYLGGIMFEEKTNTGAEHVNMKVKNCIFGTTFLQSVPDKVVFEDCTFLGFMGGNATLVHCTIQPLGAMGINLYFYDCTFKRLDGKTEALTYDFGSQCDTTRIFEDCKFEGKITPNRMLRCATFTRCEFEDITLYPSVANPAQQGITIDYEKCRVLYEDCIINSTADNFITVGPYASDEGYVKNIFKNCTINHTGKTFLSILAKPNSDSQILFEDCTINREVDTSLNPTLIKVQNLNGGI